MLRRQQSEGPDDEVAWALARIDRLRELLEGSDYRGRDPFDLVNSPLLELVPTRWWHVQLAISKFGSRIAPDWLRTLLRVPRIEDAKTYCCAYLGYDLLGDEQAAGRMLDRLVARAHKTPDGGACWGYDFLWATRQGTNQRGASTLVPGSFAMLTLVDGMIVTGDDTHQPVLERALDHYSHRHLANGTDGPFLSYFVGSSTNTHNANMLGCAALSLGAMVTGERSLAQVAADAVESTLAAIHEDGYLPYADHPSGNWTDCFHHLYVIASLTAVSWANPLVDVDRCGAALGLLRDYWHRHFEREDDLVNYFPNRLTPIDPHNFAVTALYSTLLGDEQGLAFARSLLRRVDALAWDPRHGRYIHRIHRRRRDERYFLRWTQVWMFAALCAAVAPERLTQRSHAYEELRRSRGLD
jgi:hypothetical protein